jgi:hypothetical protein
MKPLKKMQISQGQSDPVYGPCIRSERDTVRAHKKKRKRSNTGPKEHFEACMEIGCQLRKAESQRRAILYSYLGVVYTAIVDICATGEVDALRDLTKSDMDSTSDLDPVLIRNLLRATSKCALTSSTLTKRVGAIRYALMSGCPPADAPAFFKRESIERSYRKAGEKLTQEQALANATRLEINTEDDRVEASADEDGSNGEAKKDEAAPLPTVTGPSDGNKTLAAAEVPLPTPTGRAARFLKKLISKGRCRNLNARLWFDGKQLYIRDIWRPSEERGSPSAANSRSAGAVKGKAKRASA